MEKSNTDRRGSVDEKTLLLEFLLEHNATDALEYARRRKEKSRSRLNTAGVVLLLTIIYVQKTENTTRTGRENEQNWGKIALSTGVEAQESHWGYRVR